MRSVELVGILNVTPDSFSDGGLYNNVDTALRQTKQMFADGASLVDIGAESTRPGATALGAEEEWKRLEPILHRLGPRYSGKLSLDTYHPEIVRRAARYGSFIINDVTSFSDPEMIEAAVAQDVRCIVSHLPAYCGQNVQLAHQQRDISTVSQVLDELLTRAEQMQEAGIPKEHIILDPGIGFGKTIDLNWQLLEFAKHVPDFDVMIGYSKKRFLGDHGRHKIEHNLKAGRVAVAHGARYLRVHDVSGHHKLIAK